MKNSTKRAFTLAETIMTLFIVGLVVTAAVPVFTQRRQVTQVPVEIPWTTTDRGLGLTTDRGLGLTTTEKIVIGPDGAIPLNFCTVADGAVCPSDKNFDLTLYSDGNIFDVFNDQRGDFLSIAGSIMQVDGNEDGGNFIINTKTRTGPKVTTRISNSVILGGADIDKVNYFKNNVVNSFENNVVIGSDALSDMKNNVVIDSDALLDMKKNVVIGNGNSVIGNVNRVIGNDNRVASNSLAFGKNITIPSNSIAIGQNVALTDRQLFVINSGVLDDKGTPDVDDDVIKLEQYTALPQNSIAIGDHIFGNGATLAFNSSDNGDVHVSGSLIGIMLISSDERLKNIKSSYTKGLNEILQIKPVVFTYKKDINQAEYVGVIAQDLQKIFPEAVVKMPSGYYGVDNAPIFFAMMNAMKEINATKDTELARQKALETEITTLEKQLKLLNACKADDLAGKFECLVLDIKRFFKSIDFLAKSEVLNEKV